MHIRRRGSRWIGGLLLGILTLAGVERLLLAEAVDPRVLEAQKRRVAVVEKIKPSVVAIFAEGGHGGGSGVLISRHGYALTNFHVVQGAGGTMQCGLPDGVLYDAVLVGLDKVGDVALIKLLPKKEGVDFPAAQMGDSDTVKAGDWSLALGNPFLLATDFTPTVTFGLISGVHRYQYPSGTLLEYTDCIQVDTSINPGNSGGPLFNMNGELIGINGRGSFEKRGRVNSGVGYAISINQIKNFLGHLRAGLDTDHATLGALIRSEGEDGGASEEGGTVKLSVNSILEDCDAARRGLDLGDELVSFAGRSMSSVNQYKNVLGLFPKGWRVPLVYRRENVRKEILVRLMGVQQQQQGEETQGRPPRPQPGPTPQPRQPSNSPARKFFEPKPGFANFYFNKLERDRLLAAFRKHGDFASQLGPWTFEADVETLPNKPAVKAQLAVTEEKDSDGKSTKTLVRLTLGGIRYELDPLKLDEDGEKMKTPPGSGGLLAGLYLYRRLLTLGDKGFERECGHGGQEPFYPPPPNGRLPANLRDLRVDAEVLNTEHAAYSAKWFFSPKDQRLLGAEIRLEKNQDPCEIYFLDYKTVNGRLLPHRFDVRYGDRLYGRFTVQSHQLAAR